MKTNQIILLVALLMTTTISTAQKKRNTELGLGATDNSGNVDNFSLKNTGSMVYEDSTMCFATKYKFIYQLENGRESNKGFNGSMNYDFYKFGKWSNFVALEMMSNHYKGYDCIYIDLHYNYEYRSEIPSDKYRHYDSVTELTLKLKF